MPRLAPFVAAPSRHSAYRAVARVGVLVLLAAAVPWLAGPADAQAQAAGPEQDFEAIGKLDRMPEDALRIFGDKIVPEAFWAPRTSQERAASGDVATAGTLIPFYEARQLWQVFPFYDAGLKTAIAVRDMDSLRIIGTFELGALERGGNANLGGDWIAAADGARRAFLVQSDPKGVISIDFRTFETRWYPLPPGQQYTQIAGLEYDPFADRVLLLSSAVGAVLFLNSTTFVTAVDLRTGEVQLRVIRACNGPLPATDNSQTNQMAPYVANEEHVYVPCQRAGYSGTVVRLDRADVLNPAGLEEVAVGPTNVETTHVDRTSGRIFMPTYAGVIWVFDTKAMAFVGVLGALSDNVKANSLGYGLDPATGRFYFMSPSYGLGVVEGRFFPIPQARTRPDLADGGQELIVSDNRTRRLFVVVGAGLQKDYSYTIYRPSPAPVPPSPPDPDALTSDQPEVAGVAESRYNATGGAYGVRVLLSNGVSTVAPAPALGGLAPTADVFRNRLNAKCGFTDRELVAAYVVKAEADTGSTAAEATAAAIDPRTRVDIDKPSRCEPYGNDGSADRLEPFFATAPEPYDNDDEDHPRWSRDPATCSTSEGDTPVKADGDDHGAPPLGTSRAECPAPNRGDVTATARTALVGALSVGRAEAKTTITRGAGRVQVRSESVAADVNIGDGVRIAEIRSVAVSQATGRPTTDPMSTHAVSIRGVWIDGTEVCAACDPIAALETLNQALTGRAQFQFGSRAADTDLVKGSPRGALTAVQKSVERQVSDRSLVGDFTKEVPGLELIVYNDNSYWGRGRQLYQFAGVSSSATYNIVPLPKSQTFDDSADDDAGDSAGTTDGISDSGLSADDALALDPAFAGAEHAEDGGIMRRVARALQAVARGLRVFATDPRHGLAILTGWALLGLPAALFRRRLSVLSD